MIAGNRDLLVDRNFVQDTKQHLLKKPDKVSYFRSVREELTNNKDFIYLENETVELKFPELGEDVPTIKLFGTPNTCLGGSRSAFKLPGNIQSRIEHCQRLISIDTDIIVSHGPPLSVGDYSSSSASNCGCPALLKEIVERVQPKLTVFGHIHEARGVYQAKLREKEMILANVASLDKSYQPRDSLVVLNLPVL